MGRLADAFATLSADAACRIIVLRGRGGNFCSGRALPKDGEAAPPQDALEHRMAEAARLALAMADCPMPLVACVEGWAVGVGISLILWSDIAIADAAARFAAPEVKLGFPPTITAVSLIRRARRGAVMEFLLSGRTFSAVEALDAGIVTRLAASGEIEPALNELVGHLLQAQPPAVAALKALLRQTEGLDLRAALAAAVDATLQAEARPRGEGDGRQTGSTNDVTSMGKQ